MNMQSFFESTLGQISVVGAIIVLFGVILYSGRGKKFDMRAVTISALMVALSIILNQIVLFSMPQGGSVTVFSMVPIVLCAYLLGVRRGLMAGMCVGLINLMFNPYVIHPVQLILDYPLAFGALALGGIFANSKKFAMTKCYLFGILCRYICAVLSGVIFFGEYAPEGFDSLTWSLWYNFTYIAAEGAITVILINVPQISKMFERLRRTVNSQGKISADNKKQLTEKGNKKSK